MTPPKKAKAIFDAFMTHGDREIVLTKNDDSRVRCVCVGPHKVLVGRVENRELYTYNTWFEHLCDIEHCHAVKQTKWIRDEIEIF